MYQNWYKSSNKKRKPIVIGKGEKYYLNSIKNIDGSYNIVTVSIGKNKYNFYLWSDKTVKTAEKLYKEEKFNKSLNMLKKYSFDMKIRGNEND
ncbi:MAG: hypothetical protein ACOCUI_00990 [bacterium]